MDALNSHNSKSYYACVGESTHAYQSPSKDLTAINNHLNGYTLYLKKLDIVYRNRNFKLIAAALSFISVPRSLEACSTLTTLEWLVTLWWPTASTYKTGVVHPHPVHP